MCLVYLEQSDISDKLVDISGARVGHLERCNMLTRNSTLESGLVY